MSDPAILFVKPKAISQRDKKMLQGHGILIVEIDDPANAKFIRPTSELSGTQLLQAAIKAIRTSGYNASATNEFGKAICAAIELEAVRGLKPTT